MIPAELHLRHTRRWASRSTTRETQSDSELTFSYEILANPELWLVGGRRRGNFSATTEEGRSSVFRVMLLPQRPGCLLLPGVDVKTFATGDGEGDDDGVLGDGEQRRLVLCEVDYRNHGETVVVSPDLSKTTVSLGVSSASGDAQGGGGGWLVDSQRRSVVMADA